MQPKSKGASRSVDHSQYAHTSRQPHGKAQHDKHNEQDTKRIGKRILSENPNSTEEDVRANMYKNVERNVFHPGRADPHAQSG